MTVESGDDEGLWAADKREFVADWRDGVADRRDSAADDRERDADRRENELDRWERRLEARAGELGLTLDDGYDDGSRSGRSSREDAAQQRGQARDDRDRSAALRRDAALKRQELARPTLLALAFAGIAEELYNADSVDGVLTRIAETAVTTVLGCDMASITVSGREGPTTAASTHRDALEMDAAQYTCGEGPALDALRMTVVYAPAFPDDRWPELGSLPSKSGVRSALSYHLSAASPPSADPSEGSLNAYGLIESAFDHDAQEIGLILAVHASVAIRAAAERRSLEESEHALREALMSRDVIGQAKGILMERLRITPDDAFDVLRRASQRLNVKLREVARGLAETGQLRER